MNRNNPSRFTLAHTIGNSTSDSAAKMTCSRQQHFTGTLQRDETDSNQQAKTGGNSTGCD